MGFGLSWTGLGRISYWMGPGVCDRRDEGLPFWESPSRAMVAVSTFRMTAPGQI